MATKVYMEALSPTMEEGRLLTWLKKEGDGVQEGELLAEVETDKATMELVARGSGVLRKQLIGEGDTANVGTLIAVIASEDEDIGELIGGATVAEQSASREEAPEEEEVEAVGEAGAAVAAAGRTEPHQAQRGGRGESPPGKTPVPTGDGSGSAEAASARQSDSEGDSNGSGRGGRMRASPLARRLAEEGGLRLSNVQGSGPGGRIVKRDITAALEGGAATAEEVEEQAGAPQAAPAPAAAAAADFREVPLSQMRKTIAKRLTQSIGPVPHFFLTVEVDMAEAMSFRKKLNERFAEEGVKVSPNDLTIKAVAAALRKHPWVNSAWTGDAIRQYEAVHIGVAVAVDEGLITPVIRNADKKGIAEIATEVKELAGRARDKKLKPEEYTGGTFSISNLGMFGITEFTAVINPPEAAILAVGAVEDKVVVQNGEMVVRPRMRVTLSCDHRVVDGATGAKFLQTLKQNLEEPMMMLA